MAKAYANMDSIMSKAKSALTGAKLAECRGIVEGVANQAVDILRSSIAGSGTPGDVVGALQDISYGIRESGGGDDIQFEIDISFSSVTRASLQPETYGGIDNLAALYNNGVDHVMNPVHAEHFGQEIWSRTVIPGTHFMQAAAEEMKGLGSNVTVELSGEYH